MAVPELLIATVVDEALPQDFVTGDVVLAELAQPTSTRRESAIRKLVGLVAQSSNWLFGVVSLIFGLSVLATIPIVQFLSLGYLLEASRRVAVSGRIRDGFVGVRQAARLGSIVAGTAFCLIPARIVSSLAHSSQLINGDSTESRSWRFWLVLLMILTVAHIAWAWFRGGKPRHFLWPAPLTFLRQVRQRNNWQQARDSTCDFLASLRLGRYFRLGFRGFAGAIIWLIIPASMIAIGSAIPQPWGGIVSLIGSLSLAVVVMYLPFLQTRFAIEDDLTAMFNVRQVRNDFRHAPIAFLVALFCTLAFALPLYLLKAELIPRQAAFIPSLIFVIFMYPSRIMTGWAMSRAMRREKPRHFVVRWSSRLAIVPIVAFYIGFVFLTQYVSWYGRWSLYEQHAFLLPVPFLGM